MLFFFLSPNGKETGNRNMLFWWLSNCWLENDVNISGQTSPFLETFFFLYKKKSKDSKIEDMANIIFAAAKCL
jgi:hypothetical protein